MSQELLDGYTQRIKRYEKDIQKNYIQIAFNLYEVQEFDILKDSDYKNIYDYALNEFGFEKSKTNELINIYKRFFLEEIKVKRGLLTYGDFSITQLKYMLNMSDEQLKQCDPKFSVRVIKEIRTKSSTRVNNETIENTEKLKNEIPGQNIIKGVFLEKKEDEKQNTLIVSELPKSLPTTTETRTIVTETITQNNDFVPNLIDEIQLKDPDFYYNKYNKLLENHINLQKKSDNLRLYINNYKDILSYFHSELYNINNPIQNEKIEILLNEIYDFNKKNILPLKIKFMQNVI